MTTDGAGPSTSAAATPPPPPDAAPAAEPYSYVVTAHRPSAVTESLVASFTSATDINLIVSKCSRMEIHKLGQDGLQGVADVPIYGRIARICAFRPSGCQQDMLFVLTEQLAFFIVQWDASRGRMKTVTEGSASEHIGRVTDAPMAAVDHRNRAIAVHNYAGLLRVLALDPASGKVSKQFTVRTEDATIVDMRFLHGPADAPPIVAVLHEDAATKARRLNTYQLSLEQDDVLEGPWSCGSLAAGSNFLVPVSARLGGGVLVAAERSIGHYRAATSAVQCTFDPVYFSCWAAVGADDARFLLGDQTGSLYLLLLSHNDAGDLVGLSRRSVGVTTTASAISYLDSGSCFVGSRNANSQLVKLLSEPVDAVKEPHNYIQVTAEFTNLGPIVDFEVADLDKIGQGHIVACCNMGRHGSLRLVRNGIGLNEQASIELEGVRGIWSIRASTMSEHDAYLVITFVGSTHVLAMNEADELDEATLPGFATDATTLFCGSLDNDHTIQVTQHEARLLDAGSGALVHTWTSEAALVHVVSTGANEVLASTGKGQLFLLRSSLSALECVGQADLQAEVACLDIASWTTADGARLVAVGTWSSHLLILSAPALQVLVDHDLESTIIPRSTLFTALDDGHAVLVGMGDGQLAHWRISEAGALSGHKVVSIGVKPISLSRFTMAGVPYVFAATDRPSIVYEHNGKLQYSPVNESNVTHLCSFSTEAFPGALAMTKDNCLMITLLDAIQKLHIRTVPLGELPRRIAHQASSAAFGLITMSAAMDKSYVRVLSQATWDEVASLQLDQNEAGCSIVSVQHPTDDDAELFVVGTMYVLDEESEPSKGRLLLLQLAGAHSDVRELKFLGETVVNGAAYQVRAVPDHRGRVAATVGNQLVVFTMQPDPAAAAGTGPRRAFEVECKHKTLLFAVYLAVHESTLIVGDLMQSVGIFKYDAEKRSLCKVASEYEARWTTAVAAVDSTLVLAADNDKNIVALRYNEAAETDAAREDLSRVSQFNVGDLMNRIRRGSLVMQLPDAEFAACPSFIMVSVLGMISLCVLLPKARYEQLIALQAALQEHIKGVGGLSHASYRAHRIDHNTQPASNAVDGDLVELLLDLPREEVERVVASMAPQARTPVDEMVKLVEDLHRLH